MNALFRLRQDAMGTRHNDKLQINHRFSSPKRSVMRESGQRAVQWRVIDIYIANCCCSLLLTGSGLVSTQRKDR